MVAMVRLSASSFFVLLGHALVGPVKQGLEEENSRLNLKAFSDD